MVSTLEKITDCQKSIKLLSVRDIARTQGSERQAGHNEKTHIKDKSTK